MLFSVTSRVDGLRFFLEMYRERTKGRERNSVWTYEFFTVRVLKHWITLQGSCAISVLGDLQNLTWALLWETFKVPPAFSVGDWSR